MKEHFKRSIGGGGDDLWFACILIVGRSVAMVKFAVSGFS